ncbi:ribonuclease H-like domain-containing protein [Tanacetum coccineum]
MGPAQQVQSGLTGSTVTSGQATILPHAFIVGTFYDPASGAWNMNTGASSHLNNSVNSISENFNTCITGDLYPVTAPSPIPHAFLVSQHMWHQRLGHPGGEALRRLVSSNFISYNKEKPPVLCHACQLGKHARLPFISSSNVISSCFDIIHSDVWTLPILSLSDDTFDLHPTVPNPTLTTPTIGQTDPLSHQQHSTELAAQQSPTAAQPTHASSSSTQLYSPVQQPFPVAQHTPVHLQFLPTVVSHQTTIVSNPIPNSVIVQNPLVNPIPNSVYPMVTRFRVRTNRPTELLNLHVSLVSPLTKSYRDAFSDLNWQNVMRDEYHALFKNQNCNTPKIRSQRKGNNEYLAHGTLSCYKARLVANGSTQLEGVDADETFSLVVKPGTIWTVLSLAASRHWPIHQLDLNNAFLHGDLSETIYMHQPSGFQDYVHPDYTGCPTTHRSTSGYYVFLGNNLLSWSSKRQPALSRSSAEAEYRGVANVVAETCWLCNLLRELHTPLCSATLVFCDNVSAVYLSHNPIQHQRTKHIEIDIHFVRDLVAAGQV